MVLCLVLVILVARYIAVYGFARRLRCFTFLTVDIDDVHFGSSGPLQHDSVPSVVV